MAGLVIVIGLLVMTRPVARACPGPGAVRLSSVWPADGTTDVPANVRFVVRYDGVSTFAEQSVAMRALEIRPAGGGAAVQALVHDREGEGRLFALIGVRPVTDIEVGKD